MPLAEGDTLTGEHGATYLAVSPLGQANVWTAVENGTNDVVVVKEPDANDAARGFPTFQNEMVMHELLKDSSGVRQQRDRIPSTAPGEPPMLVLEITSTTLWSARAERPFALREIKRITRDALIGLRDVHARGLVYADLKMQNIMLDGFDADRPASASGKSPLQASLGDLGIVMEPMKGTVQPVSYRAPEVYFKADIGPAADIWGWGLIYCHLLEARDNFQNTGMYDTPSGSLEERETATSEALANDYGLHSDPSYSGIALPRNDADKHTGDQWEVLRQRGVEAGEVDFLRWVLRANPAERPSAAQILSSGWLDRTDGDVSQGFVPPANGTLAYDSKGAVQEDQARPVPQTEARPEQTSTQSQTSPEATAQPGVTQPIAAEPFAAQPVASQPTTAQTVPATGPSPYMAPPSSKFATTERVSSFSGEPGPGFFAGRPSPYAAKPPAT